MVQGGKLYVSDFNNHRVLIWNSIPTVNQTAADRVIGQADMTSNTAVWGSSTNLNMPRELTSDGTRLYVTEADSHRISIWNTLTPTSGQARDAVLGQPSITGYKNNSVGITANSLYMPSGISYASGRLWIADTSNDRILGIPVPGLAPEAGASVVATLTGAPSTVSNAVSLNVTVAGAGVTDYRYKVGAAASTLCDVITGYSADVAVATPITDSVSGIADADLKLCVIGKDGAGNYQSLAYPTSVTWTKETVAPTIGGGGTLTATTLIASGFNLNWTKGTDNSDVQGALRYDIYRSATNDMATVAAAEAKTLVGSGNDLDTFAVTGLSASTTYYFNVVVRDRSGNKALYTALQVDTPIVDVVAPVPGNSGTTSGANITVTSLDVTWTKGTDNLTAPSGLQYRVYRSTANNISTEADCIANGTALNSYTTDIDTMAVTGLTPNTTYYFNVLVKDPTGNVGAYTAQGIVTLPDTTIPTVGGSGTITPSNVTGSGVDLTWTKATDDASAPAALLYLAYYSTSNNISTAALALSNGTPVGSYTADIATKSVTGLSAGTTYYFNVIVKDAAGNFAPYTTVSQATVSAPGAFSITAPASPASASPTVTWGASAGVVSYSLTITSDAGCATVLQSYTGLTATSQLLTHLVGGTHYVCMTAIKAVGATTAATNQAYSFTVPTTLALGFASPNDHNISALGMNLPQGVHSDGTRLYVADTSNNRVMIWNNIPTSLSTPADVILGQPSADVNRHRNGGISSTSLHGPYAVCTGGGKLFVADYGSQRVLIWNSIPTVNRQPADLQLGQSSMTAASVNSGGISAQSLSYPSGLYCDANRLYVSDTGNNRVLVWTSLPTTNRQAADLVLGQPNMTSNSANNGGIGAGTLTNAFRVFGDASRLFVADNGNNRVLIWNSHPTANQQAADLVLGQPNMTTATANSGGLGAGSLSNPTGGYSNGTKLYVTDSSNNRVLIWNTIPTTNQQSADLVLGQATMTTASVYLGGMSAASMFQPREITSDGTSIFAVEHLSHRVLKWNAAPTTNQQPADLVVGQSATTKIGRNGVTLGAQTFNDPTAVTSDGTHLYVVEYSNNRILGWNSLPTANQQTPDIVLGQADMTSNRSNRVGSLASAQGGGLSYPRGAFTDGTRLFAADTSNHRILIWSSLPITNGQAADLVLGQTDMTTATSNQGGISAQTLVGPFSVYYDGTKLYAADTSNHRVLIWNSLPTTNKQAADVVLGQPNMTSNTANNGGIGAQTLNQPQDVKVIGSKLYVSDYSNHRILIWNSVPTVNQRAADLVLGQANMTSSSGAVAANRFNNPHSVFSDGTRLFVGNVSANNILGWSSLPTTNQQSADLLLGHNRFIDYESNDYGVTGTSLYNPRGGVVAGGRLWIADSVNDRILAVPLPGPAEAGGTANYRALIAGYPVNSSSAQSISVTVSGSSITHYRYKVGLASSTVCELITGYAAEAAVATTLSADISGLADDKLRLCVIGRNTTGVWQPLSYPTKAEWTKIP